MVRMVLASGKTSALVEQEECRNRLIVFDKGQGQPLKKEGIFYR